LSVVVNDARAHAGAVRMIDLSEKPTAGILPRSSRWCQKRHHIRTSFPF